MALLKNPDGGNPTNFGRLSFCCGVASEQLTVFAVDGGWTGGDGGGLGFSSSSRLYPKTKEGKISSKFKGSGIRLSRRRSKKFLGFSKSEEKKKSNPIRFFKTTQYLSASFSDPCRSSIPRGDSVSPSRTGSTSYRSEQNSISPVASPTAVGRGISLLRRRRMDSTSQKKTTNKKSKAPKSARWLQNQGKRRWFRRRDKTPPCSGGLMRRRKWKKLGMITGPNFFTLANSQ